MAIMKCKINATLDCKNNNEWYDLIHGIFMHIQQFAKIYHDFGSRFWVEYEDKNRDYVIDRLSEINRIYSALGYVVITGRDFDIVEKN